MKCGKTNCAGQDMRRQRLSEQIADQLETMIARGDFAPGDRLPAERVLAARLNVSRPSLREAIRTLANKGLLQTRPGGGSFVTDATDSPLIDSLVDLLEKEPASQYEVLEIRHALEGTAAYYAAIRASVEDRKNVRRRFEAMIATHEAGDPGAEIQADARFHLSVVQAAGNGILLQLMQGLFKLLHSSIGHNLDQLYEIPKIFEPLSRQHENLMKAVVEGNPERARTAAQEHSAFVDETLHKLDQEQAHRVLSLLRLMDLQS
jgi:DNA-binding FadR family transcriptional regulator